MAQENLPAVSFFDRNFGIQGRDLEKVIGVADRLPADRNEDIANQQAAFFRRSAFFEP